MIKIVKFEIKKSRKRYGKGSALAIILASLFALISAYLSITTGINSDYGLYSANMPVNSLSFTISDKPDVYIENGRIFVERSDKSLAAADELVQMLKKEYTERIEKEYGELAHPVLVNLSTFVYTTSVASGPEIKNVENKKPVSEEKNQKAEEKEAGRVGVKVEVGVGDGAGVTNPEINMSYKPPEEIRIPNLVEKMVVAFLFIIPSYFTVQVFSSSLLEDKLLRRLEVLLSATSRSDIILGKLIPYFALSLITAIAVSLYFNPVAFIFAIPVILFLFAAHSFVVMISRSYREATFLLLVVSLLITIYAFIPAVFSTAIPLSKVSPITLLLSFLRGEDVYIQDVALSFAHLGVMTSILLYLSMMALNPDVAHGRSIAGKFVEISRLSIKNSYTAFLFAFLSISFAFMAELFALISVFILPRAFMIPALILSVAVVEELIKGFIIIPHPDMRRAFATAMGFFLGEKILILANILQDYGIAFLGKYLLLPLTLHLLTAAVFVFIIQKTRPLYAFSLAILIHAVYDYTVVMLFA